MISKNALFLAENSLFLAFKVPLKDSFNIDSSSQFNTSMLIESNVSINVRT